MSMTFCPEKLPSEVTTQPQWSMWRKEVVGKDKAGKDIIGKVPYQPNGKRAKSNDSSTWCTFTTAQMTYQDIGGFNGICWMMPVKPSGLIFLDIDHCITNGTIEPWALDVVKEFDTYTEISQSGNGLHLLLNGTKPIKRCRKMGSPYEIYDCLRPCYLTGNTIEGHTRIEIRQEPLNRLFEKIFAEEIKQANNPHQTAAPGISYLSDEAVVLKAKAAKRGAEFAALWAGSLLGYNGDESAADQALMNRLSFWCGGDKAQMERLFSASALGQREKWTSRQNYRERTIDKAIAGTREFYKPKHANSTPDEVIRRITDMDLEELTEGGNAQRLERLFGDGLRYNHTLKKWSLWDGGRWRTDTNGGAMRCASNVAAALYLLAGKADGKDAREAIAGFAKATDTRKGFTNMLAIAANRLKFALTADDFDRDAWLLGAGDVTFDLKTGIPREPRRADLITKVIGAKYDREARCPLWDAFLELIFPDAELRGYMKRAVGYCLTGSMGEQVFFFCYGIGANGKSVFLAVLRALLGEYAKMADFSTFLVQRNEKVRNDLAALAGARVITAIEAEEGGRLSMQVIKSWTGGDPVTARYLFGEFFTFHPTGKIWLAANNKPAITERNHAAWRRVRLIPFTATIPEAERVSEYENVLYPELSGILNWALEGLQEYVRDGMKTPKVVLDATAEYRKENDSLEQFVSECCELGDVKACKNTVLYGTYLSFCGMSGLKALSQTKFSLDLKAREGITQTKSKHGVEWQGIDLKAEWVTGSNNPSSIAGDAKGDGLDPNAQPTQKSPLREDFAQNGTNPSPDSDSTHHQRPKEGFSVDNEGGIGPHPRRKESTPTEKQSLVCAKCGTDLTGHATMERGGKTYCALPGCGYPEREKAGAA
jgi:putative DNA primase/helicase